MRTIKPCGFNKVFILKYFLNVSAYDVHPSKSIDYNSWNTYGSNQDKSTYVNSSVDFNMSKKKINT